MRSRCTVRKNGHVGTYYVDTQPPLGGKHLMYVHYMYGNHLSAVVETMMIRGDSVYSEFTRSVEFDRGQFHRHISDNAPTLKANIEILLSDCKVPPNIREKISRAFKAKPEKKLTLSSS